MFNFTSVEIIISRKFCNCGHLFHDERHAKINWPMSKFTQTPWKRKAFLFWKMSRQYTEIWIILFLEWKTNMDVTMIQSSIRNASNSRWTPSAVKFIWKSLRSCFLINQNVNTMASQSINNKMGENQLTDEKSYARLWILPFM